MKKKWWGRGWGVLTAFLPLPPPPPFCFDLGSAFDSCSCNSYFANHKRKNTPKNHQLYIQGMLRDIILRWNIKTITHYFCCWWCFSSKTLHWSSVSMAENKTSVTKNKTPYLNYPFSLSSRYIPLYLIPPPPLPLPDSGVKSSYLATTLNLYILMCLYISWPYSYNLVE